jgi:hypothetical protein
MSRCVRSSSHKSPCSLPVRQEVLPPLPHFRMSLFSAAAYVSRKRQRPRALEIGSDQILSHFQDQLAVTFDIRPSKIEPHFSPFIRREYTVSD